MRKAFTKIGDGVLVRCLGPGPEHTFKSADAKRNRVCPKCAKVMQTYSHADIRMVQGGPK